MVSELQNQLNAIAKAKTVKLKTDLIRALPQTLRIARYLQAQANLAVVGAKLRATHDHDNEWTPEEQDEWRVVIEAYELWWSALNEDERQVLCNISFDTVAGSITRGERVVPTAFTRYRLTFVSPGIKYEHRYARKLESIRRLAVTWLQKKDDDYLRPEKAFIKVCHDVPITGRPAAWHEVEDLERE